MTVCVCVSICRRWVGVKCRYCQTSVHHWQAAASPNRRTVDVSLCPRPKSGLTTCSAVCLCSPPAAGQLQLCPITRPPHLFIKAVGADVKYHGYMLKSTVDLPVSSVCRGRAALIDILVSTEDQMSTCDVEAHDPQIMITWLCGRSDFAGLFHHLQLIILLWTVIFPQAVRRFF